MKGGLVSNRKKGEANQQQRPNGEEGKDDYAEAEEENDVFGVEEDEEDKEDEEEEEEERPKLAEGFYEIEDVRRKRIRKGQVQYLIKWRGWPETANTWEPLHNLQSCSDILDAFEHRSSNYTSRKRKRKNQVSHTQPKKKKHQLPASTRPLPIASLDNSCHSQSPPPLEWVEAAQIKDHVDNHGGTSSIHTADHLNENGSTNISLGNVSTHPYQADPKFSDVKGNAGEFLVHISDTRTSDKNGVADEHSKAECTENVQSNRFTGARKRKSGFVRRFKKDSASCELNEAQNPIARSTSESGHKSEALAVEDAESSGHDAGDKDNLDDSVNASSITKIIKPIGYSTSISNNVHDVSVTFLAMRPDGKEMVVDNNFLKANNPLLLIRFYEQHLRYSPPT